MNVYEAAQSRLKYVFSEFDNVYVSFSGGKDSGILLEICLDYVRKNCPEKKLGVFHIDYEAQYQMTTDYVHEILETNKDLIDLYHICLPIAAQCCTSMSQSYWIPWDADKRDLWVRELPKNSINESNSDIGFFTKGMWDYEFQNKFIEYIHNKNKAKKTCCLVGIRTDESFNRWRAIHSDKNKNKYDGNNWTKKMGEGMYNAYPIFDWKVDDVWAANYKGAYKYNKLYDLFYQGGVPYGKMRVASPFNDSAPESLKLYKVIDPKTWGKMIGRVNGVNFTGIYGGTTAMGWKSIKLPKGHTWKSYMEFLLSTLPENSADNYKKKLEISKKFWKEKGGCLDKKTIKKLIKKGIEVSVSEKTNYDTNKKPVAMEYLDDIDIDEFREIPTYKRMCICIMKNDHLCKYMGFSLTKTEQQLRSNAEKKYKEVL